MRHTRIASTDEQYRFLLKYAPDLLNLHFPEGTYRPVPITIHLQHYWLNVAIYETLAGDRDAVLKAIAKIDRNGPLKKEAMLIRWFTYLGSLGTAYYRWHSRNKYRHRPEWEKFFGDLVGPLALD